MNNLTPRAAKTITDANTFAKEVGHSYVGSEHLLVGLIRLGSGIAFTVLKNAGVTEKIVREKMDEFYNPVSEIQVLRERMAKLEEELKSIRPATPRDTGATQ